MNEKYFAVPERLTYKDIVNNKFNLSAYAYKQIITSSYAQPLRNFIESHDIGKEVGSFNYVDKSNKYFIKPRALQSDLFTLSFSKESIVPIAPSVFRNYSLRQENILISKDSNIGDCVILEKDYPNYTIAGGIVRLKTKEHPYVAFALMKHPYFKLQIEKNIPRGVTIRHAKTKFLECKIPFPTQKMKVIRYIEELTKAIIRKEIKIKENFQKINEKLETEIARNQKAGKFTFFYPRYVEIIKNKRLDAGTYEKEFKQIIHSIENYAGGYFTIPKNFLKGGSTPTKRIIGVGEKKWVTPTIFSEYGFFTSDDKIYCKESNITKDCALVINRTSKEKLGEHVGIASFYKFNECGVGQHNQGCYRIEGYSAEELELIVLILNSRIWRKICGSLSLGSKMKEMKITHFTKIPLPILKRELKKELVILYDNVHENPHYKTSLDKFEKTDAEMTAKLGILQLANQIKSIRKKIDYVIDKLIFNETININFDEIIF